MRRLVGVGGGARTGCDCQKGWGQGLASPPTFLTSPPSVLRIPQLRRMQEMLQKMKQQMQDQ